jgi:hypothetical protein
MKIIIEYRIVGSDAWESIELMPDEYFDLAAGEQAKIGSVPRYNHGIDYLAFAAQDLRMTRITVRDDAQHSVRVICETFWNNGENRLIERTDRGAKEYWEMIVSTKLRDAPLTSEILRIGRRDGMLIPWYHGYIRRNSDGSETETKVDTSSS